jgi:tyrosinase
MAVFTSNPITVRLQAPSEPFRRADIVVHGVDHSRASFEGRLFFDNPEATTSTPRNDENRYAGSFWVFGHGGCAGDEGHCEVPIERRAFDFRPEHELTGMSFKVIVTEKLRALVGLGQSFAVSVIPCVRPESAERLPEALLTDLLHVDRIDLLTYQ